MEAAVAFRFVLATVFILAGLAKLPRRAEFARAIDRYGVLSPSLVRPAAGTIPPLELAAGILLAIGLGTAVVAIILAVLLAIFTAAVAINLLRGRSFDCGCATPGVPSKISWATVVRNSALAGMAVAIAIERPAALALDSVALGTHSTLSAADALALAFAATVAVLGLELAREAVALRRFAEAGAPPHRGHA